MAYEELKEIPGFKDYYVAPNGDIFSNKRGRMRKLKPFLDGRKKYLLIGIIDDTGRRKKVLVHRIVAICYIPNPDNLPEVNHIDRNTQNPNRENLEWCTRKENLRDSYQTMSPVRNKRHCRLYKNNSFVSDFQSIHQAAFFAKQHFGANMTSLEKYLCSGDIEIVSEYEEKRKVRKSSSTRLTQNRTPIHIIEVHSNIDVGVFKTFSEAAFFLQRKLGIVVSSKTLQKFYSKKKVFKGYLIIRES